MRGKKNVPMTRRTEITVCKCSLDRAFMLFSFPLDELPQFADAGRTQTTLICTAKVKRQKKEQAGQAKVKARMVRLMPHH
jgi:hypothetical protein